MRKRIVIALMLVLSVFVFVGYSSDDKDVGPTTSAVTEDSKAEDTGPEWPQTVYIAVGMDDLNNQKLPDYVKVDLALDPVSAEVTVETPDSKWKITEGGKVLEVEYRNFEDDAKAAKARFEKFVVVYNGGKGMG